MSLARPKNTKRGGVIEFFAYKEGRKYIGVCLTFDIVEEKNDLEEVMKSIKEAAFLHLKVVIKNNLPDELLNRYALKEYWEKYEEFLELLGQKRYLEKERHKSASASQLLYNPEILVRQAPVTA